MRTYEEIVGKIKSSNSLLGFEVDVWVTYLPYEHAKQFLKAHVTKRDWEVEGIPNPLSREFVIRDMRHYMEFALEKALGHRGISASRSVEKFNAWVWLLGDESLTDAYRNYGAPVLKQVCERYGFPYKEMIGYDEGVVEFERMATGMMCSDGCMEGCG